MASGRGKSVMRKHESLTQKVCGHQQDTRSHAETPLLGIPTHPPLLNIKSQEASKRKIQHIDEKLIKTKIQYAIC